MKQDAQSGNGTRNIFCKRLSRRSHFLCTVFSGVQFGVALCVSLCGKYDDNNIVHLYNYTRSIGSNFL